MRSGVLATKSLSLAIVAGSISACTSVPPIESVAPPGQTPEQTTAALSLSGSDLQSERLSCRDAMLATQSLSDDDAIWSSFAIDVDDARLDINRDRPVLLSGEENERPSRCLVKIGATELSAPQPRRVLSERDLRSSYPSGTKRASNPEYVEDDQGTEDAGFSLGPFLKTGDPTIDLIGVLAEGVVAGFNAFSTNGDEQVEKPSAKSIQVDRFVPYRYKLSELEARRGAKLSVALHDRSLGSWYPTTIEIDEQKLVALSDDRHPRDPQIQHDPGSVLMTSVQLDRWERTFPELRASMLFDHLRLAMAVDPQRQIHTATRTKNEQNVEPAAGRPTPASAPSVHPSVDASPLALSDAIQLVDGGSEAAGFYTHQQHIVVPSESLPRTSLVPLRYPDGKIVYGLLEHTDDDIGLAIVFTPRLGTPRKITDRALDVGQDTGVISGLPLLIGDDVIGVWIGDMSGTRRFVTGPAVARFTEDARLN